MAWPLSQDYNEAVQDPQASFADPDLKAGQAKTNALGIPVPRSGNFADVYEYQCAGDGKWAIKCFTREVAGLRERYAEISTALHQVRLPFTVDFQYLEQGIRVCGQWFPILKMRWVEGLLLNEFVRDSLERKGQLESLNQIWLRMARRLREAGLAHGDLQHGNVILVPGSKAASLAVKLIDYDGMFVPALASRNSGEVGHPAYQHPQRAKAGIYNADLDRFSLLVVTCALRGLVVGGKELWQRYDNGDNLLFRERDLRHPSASPLFRELWQVQDEVLHHLVGHLTLACQLPVEQVVALDSLLVGDTVQSLTSEKEEQVSAVLGAGARVQRQAIVAVPAEAPAAIAASATDRDEFFTDADLPLRIPGRQDRSVGRPFWPWLAAGLAAIGMITGAVFLFRRVPADDKNLAFNNKVSPASVVKNDSKLIEKKIDAIPHNPRDIPPQWRHLDISRLAMDEDFLRIGPQGKLATREEFTGPIEVQLQARSSGKSVSVKTRAWHTIFQLAQPDTWYRLRWRITDTDMEVYINDRLTARKQLAFSKAEPTPVWVETRSEIVEVKSLEVAQFQPSPRNLTDRLAISEELDCANRGHEFPMGEAFDSTKSWKLSLEFMTPDPDAKGGAILHWGSNSERVLALRLTETALDLFVTMIGGESIKMRVDLPPVLSRRWISLQLLYDASSRQLAAIVDGKAKKKILLPEALEADGGLPIRIGRTGDDEASFLGKVRELWLGNVSNSTATTVLRPADPPMSKKIPIPDEDTLLVADKQMRAMFKEEFAEKDPSKRPRLVAQLFKQAGEGPDMALRLVCLRQIRDLAAQNVDLPVAWQSVEQIDGTFEVNRIDHYLRIMELGKKASRSRPRNEELFVMSLRVLDEIKNADAFEWLSKVVAVGKEIAARHPKEFSKALDRGAKSMEQVAKQYAIIKEFQDKLKDNSGDKIAALEIGRYLAFFKQDWEKGLHLLAGANSAPLADAAKKDLAQPSDPQARLEVADAWEALARAEPGFARLNVQERARMWYYRALPELEAGDKARVEDRLKIKFFPRNLKPGLLTEYLDGKTVIKSGLQYDAITCDWPERLLKGISVRWRGHISVPQVRHYVFSVKAAGSAKISLNDKLVLDSSKDGIAKSRPVFLIDGLHSLQAEYRSMDAAPQFEMQIRPVGLGIESKTPLTFYHLPDK